jgi:hypothetical protein
MSGSTADPLADGCADHNESAARSITGHPTGRSGFGDASLMGPAAIPRATQLMCRDHRGGLFVPARGIATSRTKNRELKSRGGQSGDGSNSESGSPGAAGPPAKHVLYRGLGMVPFRLLVRFKVFQLAGVAAVVIPISTFLSQVRLPHLNSTPSQLISQSLFSLGPLDHSSTHDITLSAHILRPRPPCQPQTLPKLTLITPMMRTYLRCCLDSRPSFEGSSG